jgi:hypothetical protein
MTNVMHKFLIYLSIYFCLTCFGLSFSPSSEAGVQLRQWFRSPGYGVSARARMEPHTGEDGCMRRGVVMVEQPGLLSPKFGATSSRVFTQSPQNVAV